jgi:hypothetical protein
VRSAIGLHGGARRFLDRAVARATAHFLRRTTSAGGLLVPSVAFLDDPARWNLVVFLENLPADISTVATASFFPDAAHQRLTSGGGCALAPGSSASPHSPQTR